MGGAYDGEAVERIERCRRVNRRAGEKYAEKGVPADEVAIAAMYSAFDLAQRHAGPSMAALEWMRTALDVMEESLLADLARANEA